MRSHSRVIVFPLAWLVPASSVFSQDVLPLFHKMRNALGGADRIAAIRDFEPLVRFARRWTVFRSGVRVAAATVERTVVNGGPRAADRSARPTSSPSSRPAELVLLGWSAASRPSVAINMQPPNNGGGFAAPAKERLMHWIFHASPSSSRLLSVLRIITGIVFVSFGTMKLFGYPPSPMPMGPIELMSERGIAGVLEVVGGLAIVLGLFTRPVAFLLSGEMAVAYFQVHFPKSRFPTVNNGVPAVLFCLLFLYMAFAGGGVWSIDALIARATDRSWRFDNRMAVAPPRRRMAS